MEVFIERLTGDAIKIEVDPSDTIARIKQLVREAESLPVGLPFSLCLGEVCLADEVIVSESPLSSDARLTMIKHEKFGLFVKNLSGKLTSIEVSESDCVGDLKDKLFSILGIPPDQQRLIYSGRQMADAEKICHYPVHPDCTIHLVIRMGGPPPGPFPHQWISQITANNNVVPTGGNRGPYPIPWDEDRGAVVVPFNNGILDVIIAFHDNTTTLDPSGKNGFIDLAMLKRISYFGLGLGTDPYELCRDPRGMVQSNDELSARMRDAVSKGSLVLPVTSEVTGSQLILRFAGLMPNTNYKLGTTSLAEHALQGAASNCFRNPQHWQLQTGEPQLIHSTGSCVPPSRS